MNPKAKTSTAAPVVQRQGFPAILIIPIQYFEVLSLFCLETSAHSVVQAGLRLITILSLPLPED